MAERVERGGGGGLGHQTSDLSFIFPLILFLPAFSLPHPQQACTTSYNEYYDCLSLLVILLSLNLPKLFLLHSFNLSCVFYL